MSDLLPTHIEAASTLAVVASSHEPLLFLDADFRVIASSASFCRSFAVDPAGIRGMLLAEIGGGIWMTPQVASLLRATASGAAEIDAYEYELQAAGEAPRSLLLYAHKLDDGEAGPLRLLLSITDVTAARAESRHKDALAREKAILLQEVQHRVANSLQIIASVLMQSARKIQSEEARGYLQSAHHRVMSIAALQRQLAETQLGQVAVRPYLVQLCESLGASMISDPGRLSLAVDADDSNIDAHSSVSIGLIVTELVINALKHAFPDQRSGRIHVGWTSSDTQWNLTVSDDGVGIADGIDTPKPGLGTGIVDALARQLDAEIVITSAEPGTVIRCSHGGTLTLAA